MCMGGGGGGGDGGGGDGCVLNEPPFHHFIEITKSVCPK